MKRILSILFFILFLTGCTPKETLIQGFSMDASYRISANNISAEKENKIQTYLNQIDSIFNVYRDDSVISKLNHFKVLAVSDSSEEILFDLIRKTVPYCNESFDISIRPVSKLWNFKTDTPVLPNKQDVQKNLSSVGYQNIRISENEIILENGAEVEGGAVVKGYVCDQIANMLTEDTALIDIGGTVKTVGKSVTAGVKSPDHNGLLCSFTLPIGKAVATSGSYERSFVLDGKLYHHILNPGTGYPAETDFVSVTVVCDSAFLADVFSTTLFAGNSMRIPDDVEVIYVTKENLVFTSAGIENFRLINQAYQLHTLTKE